jgi:hypothetical protein
VRVGAWRSLLCEDGWVRVCALAAGDRLGSALTLQAARAEHHITEQPDDLGRIDPMTGLPPQLLADRLRDRIQQASVTVRAPAAIGQVACYAGPFGSTHSVV